jgi:uncharacterized membrane protein
MARDHLLLVSRSGFTETYKRFYFRDIQAVIIRKTSTAFVISFILAILAFLCLLLTISRSSAEAGITWALITALFVVPALVSLWRGPSCVTPIKTAVQTEQLAAWSRMRAARKGMAMIRPRLLEAQGEFAPQELKASPDQQVPGQPQPQPAAPQT